MKKSILLSGAAAVVAVTAGCGPDLAQGAYGAEEQEWQNVITASYSSYRPPRIAPPATVDRASEEALAKQRGSAAENKAAEEEKTADPVTELPPASDDQKPESAAAVVDKASQDLAEEKKLGKEPAEPAADAPAQKAPKAKAEEKKAAKEAPKVESNVDHEIYVVKAGDTPGSIAQKFYGKASFYEIIMKANPQIKNARQIQIGTKLRIPKL